MTCAEFEILLCDYVDGTLDAPTRAALETHRDQCASCAELYHDVVGAVSFIERAGEVQPPPELLTRITFNIPVGRKHGVERMGLLDAIRHYFSLALHPKFAMGMAMTILSFSLLGRFAGIEVRQIRAADLSPTAVWAAADDQFHKAWQKTLKYYEGLKVVYQVQSRLKEWTDQDDNQNANGSQTQPGGKKPATNNERKGNR